MRRAKAYRTFTAPDCVVEFTRAVSGAHIMKARDARYLASFMEMDALDAIDVLYGMYHYPATSYGRDIPSFIRWYRRNADQMEIDRLAKEAALAERISKQRLPAAAYAYFDLADEPDQSAPVTRSLARAIAALESFADSVLGARA